MRFSFMVLAGVCGAVTACGPAHSTPVDAGAPKPCRDMPMTIAGPPSAAVDAGLVSNLFVIPVTVGTLSNIAVVDTGAPVTLIDPSVFTGQNLPNGQGPGPKLVLGESLTITDETVVGAGVGASLPTGPLPMLVGGDTLCHFETSFDYRQPTVFFGPATLPSSLEAAVQNPVAIEGGGLGALSLSSGTAFITIQATRIAVTVKLEGVERHFILDSGASFTTLSASAFGALVSDGRKTLAGLGASTVMGNMGLTTARAKSLTVGGAEAKNVIVAGLDSQVWASLSQEVGHPVDGLLGGSWLREFFVTVDYEHGGLTLRRYTTQDHVHDELTRLGFALRQRSGTTDYEIGAVFDGTDAKTQGLTVATKIVSIDGTAMTGLSAEAAELACRGTAGTTRKVVTDTQTLTVKVEDLLATP